LNSDDAILRLVNQQLSDRIENFVQILQISIVSGELTKVQLKIVLLAADSFFH